MKWLLIIAVVVILIIWKRKAFERLDKEHEDYLKQDGNATYIRTHWPIVVEQVESISGLSIKKERNDAVILGDANTIQVYLGQDMGRLSVIYIRQKEVIQKWTFEQSVSTQTIIDTIYQYIRK